MRALLAATAALTLTLAGCASDTTEPPPEPAATEITQSGPIELELGETANLTKSVNGPRDVDVTVTGITVAQQCHHGLNDWHDDYTHDGGFFIEVTGDIDVRESPSDFSVPQWAAATEDRTIIDVAPASECAYSPEPGAQTFGDLVIPGTTSTAVSEYWVDTLPSHWFLNEPAEDHAFSWPVPQDVHEVPDVEPASEVATEPVVAPAPAAPTFVRCYLADGTALMSDGSHTYMDSCNESAGGPYLLEDGTSIYENHPYLPAEESLPQGWHCDGPAYLCRDDEASGMIEGRQNWTP